MTEDTPNEVDPYVLEGLLYLVFVHEEIEHLVHEQTVEYLLTTLTEAIFQTYPECIDQIHQFSECGVRKVPKDRFCLHASLKLVWDL